jgi:hypothetical protein
MRELQNSEPLHEKIKNKFKEEFELPEIQRKIEALKSRKNDVLHKKPTIEEVKEHNLNYMKNRKERLEERIGERINKIRSHSQLSSKVIRTKTQDRIKLRDELEKALAQENDHFKHVILKRRQEFGKIVIHNYAPQISQRKREELQNIIDTDHLPPSKKVKRIRYERPKDSILNKTELLIPHDASRSDMNSFIQKPEYSPNTSENDRNPPKTIAFQKREENGEEYSPSRAYLPSNNNLEPVKESWGKHQQKHHIRSKSSLNNYMSRSNERNYGKLVSQRLSARDYEPEDWLLRRRNLRLEKGRDYMYRQQLPKQLSKDKINSFKEIKSCIEDIERKASKIEIDHLDHENANNILKHNVKVGSMYVDAIKAKAAIIQQL